MAIVSCVGIVNNLDSIDTDNCKSVLPHFTLAIFAMIQCNFFILDISE